MSKKVAVLSTFRIEKAKKADTGAKSNVFHCVAMTELPIRKYAYVDGEYQEVDVIHNNNCWNVTGKSKLPLSNTHNIWDVNSNLGSAYNFTKSGDTTECDIEIDETEDKVINKVNNGHIASVSIGGKNVSSTLISKGSEATILGKAYNAVDRPVIVVTKAEAWELALCQVGADSNAKITKSENDSIFYDEDKFQKTNTPAKGEIKMPGTKPEGPEPTETKTVVPETVVAQVVPTVTKTVETTIVDDLAEVNKALEIENKRVELIKTVCKNRGFSPETEENFIKSGKGIAELKTEIIEEVRKAQKASVNPMVESTKDELEKVIEGTSLAFRKMILGDKFSKEDEVLLRKSTIKPEYDSIVTSMAKMANINSFASPRTVIESIFKKDQQSTSAFATVLASAVSGAYDSLVINADVADLSFVGSVSVPTVGQDWTLYDVNVIGDIPEIEEDAPFTKRDLSTCNNKIKIKKYGDYEMLTLEAMINNRAAFNMFSDRQRAILDAHIKKDETLVTAVLTANAALSDTVALFHADHANLINLALTTENLETGRKTAVQMVDGQTVPVRIGTSPKYLIVPYALRKKAMEIVMAPEFIAYNINKDLRVIVLPGLDATSETEWYLAGPAQYGVVLGTNPTYGRSPVIESFVSQGYDAQGIGIRNFRFVGCAPKSHYYLLKSQGGI